MIINNIDMPNFTHKEIPPEKAQYIEPQLLENLQKFRDILGCPFHISSAPGALVRFYGRNSSEHRVLIDPVSKEVRKLSAAADGFPDCDIFKAWTEALSSNLFGGVGVYFDTFNNRGISQPMLHLDLRSLPLIWFRKQGIYHYPHKDEAFYKELRREFEKAGRKG